MDQDHRHGRISIDRLAVALERKRNNEQVRRRLLRRIIKTVLKFHSAIQKRLCCIQMVAIRIDDMDVRKRQQFLQEKCRSGIHAAAHDGDAANIVKIRQQPSKRLLVGVQEKSLQPRGSQDQALECFKNERNKRRRGCRCWYSSFQLLLEERS